MRYIDIIRRASRSLKSAKLRTLLTSLAIAVGGFTLTLTLAGSNGARNYADKLVSSNFDPSELLVGRDAEIANDGPPSSRPQEYDDTITTFNGAGGGGGIQIKRMTRVDLDEIKALPFVEQVRENYQILTQHITREGQKKYTVSTEAYNPAQKPELSYGTLPTSGDIAEGEVLLPDSYVSILGFSDVQDAIGREVSITVRKPFTKELASQILGSVGTDPVALANASQIAVGVEVQTKILKVAGVTKKSATSFNFGAAPILISASDARGLYEFTAKGTPDYDKFVYAYVRVKEGESTSKIADAEKKTKRKRLLYSKRTRYTKKLATNSKYSTDCGNGVRIYYSCSVGIWHY